MAITIVVLNNYPIPNTSPSLLHVDFRISNTVAPFGPYYYSAGDVPATTPDLQAHLDGRADELWAAAAVGGVVDLAPALASSHVLIDEEGITIAIDNNNVDDIRFRKISSYLGGINAKTVDIDTLFSGIEFSGIAKNSAYVGYLWNFAYNHDKTKSVALALYSSGRVSLDLTIAGSDTLNSQFFDIYTNINNASGINYGFAIRAACKATAAAGFGTGQLFQLENSTGALVDALALTAEWITATSGSENSKAAIKTYGGGALANRLSMDKDGAYFDAPPFVKQAASPGTVPSGYTPVQVGKPFNQVNVTGLTETTIAEINIEAGAMSDDGLARLDVPYRYLNNTLSDKNFTIKVYIDSTEILSDASGALTTNADARLGRIIAHLSQADANNSQRLHFEHHLSAPVANGSTIARGGAFDVIGGNTSSIDLSTGSHTLSIKVTLSSNDPTTHSLRAGGSVNDGPYAL